MALFVLDTDILTLFERGHAAVVARVAKHSPSEIAVSVVTVEEQLSGWYAQLRNIAQGCLQRPLRKEQQVQAERAVSHKEKQDEDEKRPKLRHETLMKPSGWDGW